MKLVNEKYVDGWDDPRLYTLAALRRFFFKKMNRKRISRN